VVQVGAAAQLTMQAVVVVAQVDEVVTILVFKVKINQTQQVVVVTAAQDEQATSQDLG
jgi:hypothetical protein